jgi:hypothetical protein
MKIEVVVVTPSKVVRTMAVADIKEAKSVANHIDKANMIAVRYWDGTHMVEISKFPLFGQTEWKICDLGSQENKAKNAKLLQRYKKSSYAK